MSQTILSVVLEAEPESAGRLARLIEDLKRDEEAPRPGAIELYDRLKEGVPSLHFMSMSVFQDAQYDPIFVIEANFDGRPGPFWAQLEATLGSYLRDMLRCCKRPSDDDGPLYDAVTKAHSRYPLAPYLEARTLRPSVFHQGNRGLDRGRILREGELFLATRAALAQPDPTAPNPYRSMTAQQIHQSLRAALVTRFAWLDAPAPARIPAAERAGDLLRFFGFALSRPARTLDSRLGDCGDHPDLAFPHPARGRGRAGRRAPLPHASAADGTGLSHPVGRADDRQPVRSRTRSRRWRTRRVSSSGWPCSWPATS